MSDGALMTAKQAAAYLSVPVRSIYDLGLPRYNLYLPAYPATMKLRGKEAQERRLKSGIDVKKPPHTYRPTDAAHSAASLSLAQNSLCSRRTAFHHSGLPGCIH